jgi:signal transduction histidine kinase
VPTPAHNEKEYQFSPDAMLPAWFVTDRDLCIQDQSDFASDLVRSCSNSRELNGRLSLQLPVPEGYESLWECILDSKYDDNFLYIKEALTVIRKHFAILEEFNNSNPAESIDSLLRRLRSVKGLGDIVTSYMYFNPDGAVLKLGVKVSPPQGLKLQSPVDLEGTSVEYIDVVMAYQLKKTGDPNQPTRIEIHATQPAIHDVTMRHRLWDESKKQTKEREEARITQFLSHALKTPLANTQSILKTIKTPGLDRAVREELILELESLISDVEHLVSLLLFINTVEDIAAPLRMVSADDNGPWERFDVEDIEDTVATALQSVFNRRTGREIDVRKVATLFELKSLAVPSHDAEAGGIAYFKNLARQLIQVELNDPNQEFAICPVIESGSQETSDVSKKAKTVLLDLVLVELIVNAIKNADESIPEVGTKIWLDDRSNTVVIEVTNNGKQLDTGDDTDAALQKHGEKRRALGNLLNRKAVNALHWNLTGRSIPGYGTVFMIEMPLKR